MHHINCPYNHFHAFMNCLKFSFSNCYDKTIALPITSENMEMKLN